MLNEYDIITSNSNIPDSSSDAEDEELGYAVAPSVPFPAIRRAIDAVSASEPEFPKLFHRVNDSLSSDSLSVIQQPHRLQCGPLDADWVENAEEIESQSVYRKVANWVFSQRNYFAKIDMTEDDIEVIDPIDLFHDSLLDEFLLVTRSSSEKRVLLREFTRHYYNMLSVAEALRRYEYDFLRKPVENASFEMIDFVADDFVCSEMEQPYLGIETVLQDYIVIDRDGSEIETDTNWNIEAFENDSATTEGEQVDIKDYKTNETDILSLRCSEVLPPTRYSDDCSSVTCPTDAFEITTTVVADNVSESVENETDIWEDAKAIPHWLDHEIEEHLFSQPHRPLYYYRDRIKGCYRIIGVEDETVVLFSGNDDDSIFYGAEGGEINRTDVSILRRSNSTLLMNSSNNLGKRALFSSSNSKELQQRSKDGPVEKKTDSGIEDAEDCSLDDTVSETSLSAKECRELGRVTKVIRSRESKTVKFQLDNPERTFLEYCFVVLATLCFVLSLIFYIEANF